MRHADKSGLESLTMRNLASKLGVEAMSLSNHVTSENNVVDSIVDIVVEEIELATSGEPWGVAIRQCEISAHTTYLRHPWACSLVMAAPHCGVAGVPRLRYIESLLNHRREFGFSPELTYRRYHAIDSHIMGHRMWEFGHGTGDTNVEELANTFIQEIADAYPSLVMHAKQHFEPLSSHGVSDVDFGLNLILDGFSRARGTALHKFPSARSTPWRCFAISFPRSQSTGARRSEVRCAPIKVFFSWVNSFESTLHSLRSPTESAVNQCRIRLQFAEVREQSL